ncbi:MAG: hypothetical protein JNL50_09230 [Phycisphaerae bacterium]|nr:hypothetical protein [Phycisphaerae bacterium]
MNTRSTTSLRPLASIALLAAAGLAGAAHAGVTWSSQLPADFYQHQKSDPKADGTWIPNPLKPAYDSKNWWEQKGGWCGTTAWVNAIYAQEARFNGVFDNSKRKGADASHKGKGWLDRFNYANEDLAIIAGKNYGGTDGAVAWRDDIVTYTKNAGYAKPAIDTYYTGGGKIKVKDADDNVKDSGFSTFLSVFNAGIKSNRSVVVHIKAGTNTTAWWCKSNSFHVITGAGVDFANNSIIYADPDDTFHGGGWDTGYQAAFDHRYTDTDALPVPDVTKQASIDKYYSTVKLAADGLTFDSGPYKGAVISQIFTYAVPSGGPISLASIGVLAALRRRR